MAEFLMKLKDIEDDDDELMQRATKIGIVNKHRDRLFIFHLMQNKAVN